MRELVYKNLISREAKKREVCMEETIKENGYLSKILKKTQYFVRGVKTLETSAEFNSWVESKENMPENYDRKFHVMKIHSDAAKTDTVICKSRGSFYVLLGKDVYHIIFIHSLRMEVSSIHEEKVG